MTPPPPLRRFLLLFLIALGQLPSGAAGRPPAPQKYALIIAIGDYPAANGWPKISSVRDAGYLQTVLAEQGFPAAHISIVKDAEASVAGIKNAFAALTAQVDTGDIVVVHISSHGEQVEADNYNKIDGLDECVVTYHAVSPLVSKDYQKDQAEYLRGHVLGSWVRALRSKLGKNGDLVVFMDNCHSGDGTRGLAKVRGGDIPFVSAHFDPAKHVRSDSSMIFRDELEDGVNGAGLASYEVFSASRPEELDYETTDEKTGLGMGSLTYAICKAFSGLSAGNAYPTYRELFARIQSVMNVKVPQQHPLLEGNGTDRLLFGGQFIHQQPYIEISAIDGDRRSVTLRQGTLAGLDEGALIAVYPAGTRDTAGKKPLCTGKIVAASGFSATAVLDGNLSLTQPAAGWVFVTSRIFRANPVRLRLNVGKRAAEIRSMLAGDSAVQIVETNPELTLVDSSLKISGNGYTFAMVTGENLTEKLQAYAQYKFLQQLSSTIPGVSVEVKLLLTRNGRPDTAETNRRIKGGRLEVYDKDVLTLWIHNTGARDAYVNILDMQPDGLINPVLPNRNLSYPIYSHDLKIPAGQEYYLPAGDVISVGPPFGTEVYKVFASESEIDVEDLAVTRGAGRKGVMTEIEKLIQNSYGLSRGAGSASTANADVTTSEYLFLIKPRP
jgi:hypothetical protein